MPILAGMDKKMKTRKKRKLIILTHKKQWINWFLVAHFYTVNTVQVPASQRFGLIHFNQSVCPNFRLAVRIDIHAFYLFNRTDQEGLLHRTTWETAPGELAGHLAVTCKNIHGRLWDVPSVNQFKKGLFQPDTSFPKPSQIGTLPKEISGFGSTKQLSLCIDAKLLSNRCAKYQDTYFKFQCHYFRVSIIV